MPRHQPLFQIPSLLLLSCTIYAADQLVTDSPPTSDTTNTILPASEPPSPPLPPSNSIEEEVLVDSVSITSDGVTRSTTSHATTTHTTLSGPPVMTTRSQSGHTGGPPPAPPTSRLPEPESSDSRGCGLGSGITLLGFFMVVFTLGKRHDVYKK